MIELTVNGATRTLDVQPDRTLLRVLREELGLTSVREACGSACADPARCSLTANHCQPVCFLARKQRGTQ